MIGLRLFAALAHGSDTSVDILLILLYNLGAMGISRVCCCRIRSESSVEFSSLPVSRKHESKTNSHEMTPYGVTYTIPGVHPEQRRAGWKHDWRYLYASILISMVAFIVRSFFRIIEYAQG